MKERRLGVLRESALALSCAVLPLVLSCAPEPKQDDFKSQGGISPDPTGIISGTILYVGPRPACEYAKGKPTRIRGRTVMTLFQFDNPPPPEGRATTALNLSFYNPEQLFTLEDCRAEGEEADPTERITRSMAFRWPQIPLGTTREVEYQIRSFYDADEDMDPFFSVTNLPTAGDIAGAAVADVQDATKGFLRIEMPRVKDAQNGFERQNVIVALGNYVWMERPAFQVNAANRFLDSSRPVVVGQTETGAIDVGLTLENAWSQTCGKLANNCGLTLQQLDEEETAAAFKASAVHIDFSPEKYAFVSEPVDVVTVKVGAPDVSGGDGVPDPHPLMGSNLGVPWFTPISIMTRTAPTAAMADIESRAGIPNVRLIGSVLLDGTTLRPKKRMRTGDIEIAVPSVAAVELSPTDPQCRVPYLAPGNYTRAFESRLTYCSELPTGIYGISVIQGVAGGTRRAEPDKSVSDTGFVLEGGRLSGQAWTLPNDLAVEAQVGKGHTLESQGRHTLFVVHDPKPDETGDCSRAPDPDNDLKPREVKYRGLCEPGQERATENPAGAIGAGIDGQACLPSSCCEGVKHLCGLELCEPCDDESCPGVDLGGRTIRRGPTSIVGTGENGMPVPNCVPFAIPELCCN